jgi:hypothetical protein
MVLAIVSAQRQETGESPTRASGGYVAITSDRN